MFSMVVSAKTHLGQRDVTDNARKGDRFTLAFRRCVLLAKTLYYVPTIRTYVCMYVCVRAYVCMWVCMCVCMYVCVCMCVYVCVCMHACMHACTGGFRGA